MFGKLKDVFFFPVAHYFAFFARIQLALWKPRVIVITGSSGKTTLFSLIESQLGDVAHYSHHANSALGIPFDILGLHRKNLELIEWFGIILKAPIRAFKKPYNQKIYVAECDADRPGEGKFLAKLLKPEVTLWVSTSRTHSMNFDKLVPGKFNTVEEAIAYEFGYFAENTSKLVVLNSESELMEKQAKRTHAKIEEVSIRNLKDYKITKDGTEFTTRDTKYKFTALLPKEIFYSISMVGLLYDYLEIKFDPTFKALHLPHARSSIFKGIKNTAIIDSTYNANYSSMKAIINMFAAFPAKTKWAVLGDMLEQGNVEQEEHEKLAELVVKQSYERIVLLGPRLKKYTYPILKEKQKNTPVDSFESPKEVLDFLLTNITGGETILFKGARFLEGVIENLLLDKSQKSELSRREAVWEKRRRKWGL